MPETNWRYRVLSAARHLNHWCYRNFWIPRRIATAVENLHWRVERWAVTLRTRYEQVADSDVFMCRDCRVGSRHLLIHQTEAHDRWHDRNPDD